LISKKPSEEFRGIYVEGNLNPTRRSVLVPGSLGVYIGGGSYNPAQVRRDGGVTSHVAKIDKILADINDKDHVVMTIEEIQSLIRICMPDDDETERVWNTEAVAESIGQCATLHKQKTGFVYVDRDRQLMESRRETQGILTGGEAGKVPDTHLTVFMLRTKQKGEDHANWWPQIRFPSGRYAFAFAI
jgi:hypothetical protein